MKLRKLKHLLQEQQGYPVKEILAKDRRQVWLLEAGILFPKRQIIITTYKHTWKTP